MIVSIKRRQLSEKNSNSAVSLIIAALAAFCTYSCMYAFRKPFTVGTFEGLTFLHIHFKVWLIISQLFGYTLSKFYGIKFISESVSKNKAILIIQLISISWLALLLFAIIPPPWNIFCLFLNGFPLGMVWGLVFNYIEGRRTTEFLGAVLCVSFIFSSGFVKSIGSYLMLNYSISEFWMPFYTGLIFIIPLLVSVFILQSTPNPTLEDVKYRTQRKPMSATDRKRLLFNFFPGILLLVITYIILTVIRDFRDNFAAEIWKENNVVSSEIFIKTEIPISIFILITISLMMFIKNNKSALFINHLIVISGFLITLLSTYLFQINDLSVTKWMILSGLGLYMGYVPFNVMFFDRLIAYLKVAGTVGFLMYLADSFGYMGSFIVLLLKELYTIQISWTKFFIQLFVFSSILGIVCTILSWLYFQNKKKA
jgi:hypothetical protein